MSRTTISLLKFKLFTYLLCFFFSCFVLPRYTLYWLACWIMFFFFFFLSTTNYHVMLSKLLVKWNNDKAKNSYYKPWIIIISNKCTTAKLIYLFHCLMLCMSPEYLQFIQWNCFEWKEISETTFKWKWKTTKKKTQIFRITFALYINNYRCCTHFYCLTDIA